MVTFCSFDNYTYKSARPQFVFHKQFSIAGSFIIGNNSQFNSRFVIRSFYNQKFIGTIKRYNFTEFIYKQTNSYNTFDECFNK